MSATAQPALPEVPPDLRVRPPEGGTHLFFEDFDLQSVIGPAAPAEPVAAPLFSESELVAACDACRNEGIRLGLEQAGAEQAEAQAQALAATAAALAEAAQIARDAAEARAADVAGLLLSALGAVLPDLCARFGPAEAAAVARSLRDELRHEPSACVRAHAQTCTELAAVFATLDPELHAMLRLIPTETMAPGDVRIEWPNGAAVRDGAALWRQAAAVLAPLDLLSPHLQAVPPPGAPVATGKTTKDAVPAKPPAARPNRSRSRAAGGATATARQAQPAMAE